jgi:Tfp pilus assembly protein PilN
VPRVNLLPREILENRRFRNVQVLLALVVALTLALAGVAFWWSDRIVTDAKDSLAAAQARTVALQAKERTYAAVPKTLAELEYARTARETVMTNDVAWYTYLSELVDAAPGGVDFQTLTLKVPAPAAGGATPAAAAATADPFLPVGALGTVSVTGITGTYPRVAAWMDALDKVAGLEVTTLENATRGTDADGAGEITFSSTITLTEDARTHRFDRKAS